MSEQANGGQAAPAASIESRIESALFGSLKPKAKQASAPQSAPQQQPNEPEPEAQAPSDEDASPEAEASESTAPAQEETFEFEIDGEKYALPKKLEKAVMQERDYRQKTMSLSEKEKNYEFLNEQARVSHLQRQFETEIAPELSQIQAYDAVLKQPVDWSSMSNDEAFRKKIQLDQWKEERAELERKIQGKHHQWSEKTNAAIRDLQSKAQELIAKRIPNYSDATWKAITEHAKNDGYTESELKLILDPRHKVTLWKAQQYDEIKSKATKTVADVKTVKTSSNNPMPQAVKEKLAFRKQISKAAPGTPEYRRAVESRVGSIFNRR
jgi:hypothetical protein